MTNLIELKARIDAYRDANLCSPLHIVINDQNCADEHIAYCMVKLEEGEALDICAALLQLNVRSRLIVCGEDEALLDESTEQTLYYNHNGAWPE